MSKRSGFNQREMTDSERFEFAVSSIVGRRLTFTELTGADAASESIN